MDNPNGFEVLEAGEELNCKPTDQTVIETLIIVHLDKLVQVDGVELKDQTQMVAPHKVVEQFDDALNILSVVFFQKQK